MPYELNWEDRGLLFKFWDVVTGDELVQSNLDAYSDPRFQNIEYELVVHSKSSVFEAPAEKVRQVARMDAEASKSNPRLKIAIVASQIVMRGLANLYRLQSEGEGGTWETEFFEIEEEARRWLAETLD